MDSFPILSVITYLPLLGALIIFFLPRATPDQTRQIALWTAIATFAASLIMLAGFDINQAGMQWTEHMEWLPGVGINYDMGVDGVSVLLVVLTTLLSLIAVIASFDPIQRRVREYYIAILLLEVGMIGVFLALDLFLFYIFFELTLIPMALLIGVWGSANRVYASVKFFLYTLAGSLLMLVAIVATYQAYYEQTGVRTLNVLQLAEGNYGHNFQMWVFAAFFIAFAIKIPMWPFHTWLPDAHVEAPTAGSVLLAGVLLKMGGYGLIRFNLSLYPDASRDWAPVIIVLSVIAIIYGALVALVQPDLKKLIAYSSVSHMGFVTLGIFAFNMQGMMGAMLVMVSHGLVTGALFLCVGVVYERAHTRLISAFGGLATRMPVYASIFGVFMLASIGLPGLSGFVGEFLAILGAFREYRWAGVISMAVVVLSAWYMMLMFQRVVFGRAPGEPPDPHDGALLSSVQPDEPDKHGFHGVPTVSGGSGMSMAGEENLESEHVPRVHDEPEFPEDLEHGADARAGHVPVWPDLTAKELVTLVPLLILTVVMGVYPSPFMDIMRSTLELVLQPFGSVGV
ncbi:MAG TPA: NADH-quinone oxidoreductase subunit M [Thermomicrobiales bacterium]|nr:NADH-quinone oxidoreductase subunit M [Thermomicrobiales bacterium]